MAREDAATEDPLIGQVLNGRFQILEPLGMGGMGKVYKAVQQPLDRVVALKVLNPRYDGSKDPGFERRFFLEASLTSRLKHPNTVTVHDYGRTDDGIYFIAMEFIEGETLQALLAREGRVSWPRALAIGAQVARSLREAHKAGLVHRDLKPANIMLISEGTGGDVVKVLDFGLVKSVMPDEKRPNETEITQAGVLLGSPLYMAPEQARSEADARTDLYSLGVVLFQAIAGRPPFQGKESIDLIVKHVREAPPELRSLVPELPLEVNALVMKCLQKLPEARFQSMEELLEAMRMATQGQGISAVFADPRTASSSQQPRITHPLAVGQRQRVHLVSPQPDGDVVEPIQSLELDVTESGVSRLSRKPPRAALLGALVVVFGVAFGGFVAWRSLAPKTEVKVPTPAPAPVPVPAPVSPPPVHPLAPRTVSFDVSSEPPGASVTRDGARVGVTPLVFELPVEGSAPATAEVTMTLDGYEPVTLRAQGSQGRVPVHQLLSKKKTPAPTPGPVKKPKPESKHDGYKDDPYQ
jgi:serine/threonine-protein kinase